MTDTPEQIRVRGVQSIEDAVARINGPDSLKSILRDFLVDAHIPFCIALSQITDPEMEKLSTRLRATATALAMVNAFNEFIRTTYPPEEWAKQSNALKILVNLAIAEGPLS